MTTQLSINMQRLDIACHGMTMQTAIQAHICICCKQPIKHVGSRAESVPGAIYSLDGKAEYFDPEGECREKINGDRCPQCFVDAAIAAQEGEE